MKEQDVDVSINPQDVLDEIGRESPALKETLDKNPALEGDLLKDPEVLQRLLVLSRTSHTEIRSSHYPPADEMIKVETIHPGYISHLMDMHKNALENNNKMSNKGMEYVFKERMFGQVCGLVLGVLGVSAGVYLGLNDHDVLGGVIGGSTVIALVTVFVTGKVSRVDRSSEQNDQEN
ncbi:hypothetical protein HGG82_05330 [Marinomonas sp. M1K-6]|uniref:DUF2335 domain-containing protein n=1 Tax=Marinomonas profundi TaxID=2726122 RepID=A0A847R0K6_9GAMM|nr:hypothetical protein [Marinomonas profundi]NLQ17045.1 hypothetical protein [Marinomonas profundi]UDV04754.1 hypothetical protein J8N69_08440 [Marinomonas profundi]